MKQLTLLIFTALISFTAISETVTGKVTDSNNKAVRNAAIFINGKFTYTDYYGKYRIRNIPKGTHQMRVEKNNTTIATSSVSVDNTKVVKDIKTQ